MHIGVGAGKGARGIAGILAPLPLAVAAGLVIGKQFGIFACIVAADRVGFARRPEGASWAQIWGVSVLCGIGFTMSLFIGQLAFPGDAARIDAARIGTLAGSLLSALAGWAVLRLARPAEPIADDAAEAEEIFGADWPDGDQRASREISGETR